MREGMTRSKRQKEFVIISCCGDQASPLLRFSHRPFKQYHVMVDAEQEDFQQFYPTEQSAHCATVIMNYIFKQYPHQRESL
jgi:hypothetical protein